MSFQQKIEINLRTPREIEEEKTELALQRPSLSYAEVTAIAEQRIKDLAAASVGGAAGAVYQERAIGAYELWHDLTKDVHGKADNARLSQLAGLSEPLN